MRSLIGLCVLVATFSAQAATYQFTEMKPGGSGVGLEKSYLWSVTNPDGRVISSIMGGEEAYEIARALGVTAPEDLVGKKFESENSVQNALDQLKLKGRYNGNYVSPTNEEIAHYILNQMAYGRCGKLDSISETDALGFGNYLTVEDGKLDQDRVIRILESHVAKMNEINHHNVTIKIQKADSSRFNTNIRSLYVFYYEALLTETSWDGKISTRSVLFMALPGTTTPIFCNMAK